MNIFPFRVKVLDLTTGVPSHTYEAVCLKFYEHEDKAVVMSMDPAKTNSLSVVEIQSLVVFEEEALCFLSMTHTAQANWLKKEKEKVYSQMNKVRPETAHDRLEQERDLEDYKKEHPIEGKQLNFRDGVKEKERLRKKYEAEQSGIETIDKIIGKPEGTPLDTKLDDRDYDGKD